MAKAQNLLDAKNAELEEIKRQVAGELAKAQNLLDAKNAELEEIKRKHQELVTAFSGSTLSAGQEAQTFELSPTTGRLTMAGDASYDTPFKLANAGVDD